MSLTHVMYMYLYRRDENKTLVCHVKYWYQTFQNTCTKVLYRIIEIEFSSENKPCFVWFVYKKFIISEILPQNINILQNDVKKCLLRRSWNCLSQKVCKIRTLDSISLKKLIHLYRYCFNCLYYLCTGNTSVHWCTCLVFENRR